MKLNLLSESTAASRRLTRCCSRLQPIALGLLATIVITASVGKVAFAQTSATPSKADPKTAPAIENILETYDDQNVTSIEIAGRPDIDVSQFESLFTQKAGQPFDEDKVDQTIEALEATGKFKDMQLQVDPSSDGVRVLMIPDGAIYFGIFQFPGAERFAYSRLAQIANFPPDAPFNNTDVEKDRQSLLNFFRQEGYFQADVTAETQIQQDHGLASIIFHVKLKEHARFGAIQIDNAKSVDPAQLRQSLQTFKARLRGAAIRPGKNYNHATITKATNYLQSTLARQDRLAAQVKLEGAEYHADTNRADIHFDVNSGPLIHVKVEGAHLWSWTRKNLLPVYQGVGVDPELVQEGRQALISYFQAKGYFDVTVESQYKKDTAGNTIVYQIAKDKKHKVDGVSISGNKILPSDDLTARLVVEKKHFLSPGKYSEKLVRNSVNNLKAIYQSEGFSNVEVTSKVENHGNDIQIAFHVVEGPRDVVNTLRIEGADTFPATSYAPNGLKLAAGQPYSQKLVQTDRANIVSHYLQAGYLVSSFRETAHAVSRSDPHRIDVVYSIYEGPRVFAGDLVTLGRDHTKQRLIDEDVASIKPQQPLTATNLLTSESQLYNHTGVFDWAEVSTRRPITTQNKEDVLIKVHEGKKNQLTYGFGFEWINRGGSIPGGTVALPGLPPIGLPANFTASQQTFFGPRGTVQFTRNNVRGKGETLSFTGFAGRLDQRGAAYYIDPNFLWSRWRSTASFSAERNEENPIFSSQAELLSYQLQRNLDKAKLVSLFLRYSFSQTNLTRVEIPQLVLPVDRNVKLSTIAANLTRDSRDNPLDEHKGMLDTLELDFNTTKLGSSVDFVKLTGQAAYYKQGFHNIVFANSIRIGLAQPFANSRVPLSETFFTGGGNTLRGFPLDGAGPQRQVEVCSNGATGCNIFIQVPSGGKELLLINSEARIPLPIRKGLGMVAFYDGGNVFPQIGFHDFTSLYSNNVGFGLRYATPVGPVRIDIGRNLNPIRGIQATQYFISIGQAF